VDLDELGSFLKSRRDRLSPEAVGLTPGTRRRVPGLRRDEVARLASLSADYYTELEQGRGQCPSEPVLHGLVRALRLDPDETDHLFHLAGHPRRPARGPYWCRRRCTSSWSAWRTPRPW
jgi:hypothetical protein